MIEVINLDKRFDKVQALSALNLRVKKGSIYGLVGTNGSGKTTALKHITGILRADGGTVRIEGADVYENLKIKESLGFIPDDLYFFNMYNLRDSARFYSRLYPHWNPDVYRGMLADFELDEKRRLSRFSKGMQKQAAFILTLSAGPDYLILDEPIDGLDPLVRKLVWKHIVGGVADREMTVLVSSHNLREMEGVCDAIGILSKGSMLIERDLDELKSDIHKVQVAFPEDAPKAGRYEGLNVLHAESRGAVDLLIVRDAREAVEAVIRRQSPLIFDLLPLTLEEIFIYEIGGGSNAIDSILL
ncbi:MAG: ABC transporter ATP-binding protein [Proteiniphilum sp.]|jgi:ABC-2 type transport system ATP-binding protein|nr:ABC transporter ATP-binding protein [Proteiniphilum sp.]